MNRLDFVGNVAAGVETLGLENTPLIYALAKVRWESVEDRDEVLGWLGAPDGSA